MKRLALLTLFVSGTALALRPAEPKALLVVGARVSLTPDGPLLAGKATADRVIDVVDSSQKRYRFDEQGPGYRLGLYVDTKHLATLTFGGAELVPAMTDEPLSASSPGMKLDAGTRVASVKAAKNGFSKVRVEWTWKGGSFRVDGYIQSDKLTKTLNRFETSSVQLVADVTAPGTFKLTATPGGKAFVTRKGKERVELQTLDTEGTYTLVRTGQGAVGWIAAKQLQPITEPRGLGDIGTIGHGSGTGSAPHAGTLPIGTRLYDKIDGVDVGEVTGQFDFTAQQTKDGWKRFDLKTSFGTAKVWAK
jgi:hypothetical protein